MTTYGDFQLPFYGVIHNRNLFFPNAKINQFNKPSISLKNIINSRLPTKNPYKSNFGKLWYPQMDIDSCYNTSKGGYSYGPMGPYYATGLGNYPRSMYKKVKFGTNNLDDPEPKSLGKSRAFFIIHNQHNIDQQIQQILEKSNRGDLIHYPFSPNGYQIAKVIRDPTNGNLRISSWKRHMDFGTNRYPSPPPKRHSRNIVRTERFIIPSDVDPQDLQYHINKILNKKEYGRNIAVPGDTIFYSRVTSNYPGYEAYTWNIISDKDGNNLTTQRTFFFGKSNKKKRKSKSPKRKIVYCLPKEHKYPVNTKKKCSAALSYARYAPDPCQIARCVSRNCKKYPDVGKYSKLMKECKTKSKKK